MRNKLQYLANSLLHSIDAGRFACPACKSRKSTLVERKFLVTTLRRCSECELLFRAPTTSSEENARFYQEQYQQGFTTDLPSTDELAFLKRSGFKGTEKDYSYVIAILGQLGLNRGSRVFDYGCSWGYGSWQLAQAGFDVTAFEISCPRSRYAVEKLGVRLNSSSAETDGSFDVFFSSHVIEHVPNPSTMLREGLRLLRPGGLFVCFTPNGSERYRSSNPRSYSRLWGLAHPQLICERWIAANARSLPWFVSSTPVDGDALCNWSTERLVSGRLDRPEMLFVVKQQ